MQILVLVAGTNEPSNSNVLADAFIEGMQKMNGIDVSKHRLKDLQIDHFTMDHYKPDAPEEKDFQMIHTQLERADAFMIATPIWNFGVPAHLKNLIDRMGSFGLDRETRSKGQLKRKPFYLIFTGGAPMPAWKGLMRFTTSFVREGLRYFNATPFGTHFEGKCMKGQGTFDLVVNDRPASLETVRQKGEIFAARVQEFIESGKLPLRMRAVWTLYRWGQAFVKRL